MKDYSILRLAGVALVSTVITSVAFAALKPLTTYDQLLQYLQQGYDVRAIINFDKCHLEATKSTLAKIDSSSSTRINFTIFSHYQVLDGQNLRYAIATSNTILTEHRTFGPVYAYGRLRVFEDNTAKFYTAYYDPKTFEVKATATYDCQINNESNAGGLVLFDANA